MDSGIISSITITGIFLRTVMLSLVGCAVGVRLGQHHNQGDKKSPDVINTKVASRLSMMALLP